MKGFPFFLEHISEGGTSIHVATFKNLLVYLEAVTPNLLKGV